MRFASKSLVVAAVAIAASAGHVEEALACGGCLTGPVENTQVTSHRMALSLSSEATTLWDQIEYDGDPESFAWVLPVKGVAQVRLSSDAMFGLLDALTAVQVVGPPPPCGFQGCASAAGSGDFDGAPNAGAGGGDVTVVAHETVGPYETVQLSSEDPTALQTWLEANGYNIPDDIAPIVRAYVAEGFDFLALKLVPGEGVRSMRPVRITTPGASPELPLRMVAAGTGAVTPITLWVLGEGRYEPTNFSSFLIQESALVWDWSTSASNYKELRSAGFASTGGASWLVEAAEPMSPYALRDQLTSTAEYDPQGSGYADENGQGAVEAAEADMDAMFGQLDAGSVWVSRFYGELSRAALATDLALGASADQSSVQRFFQVTNTTGPTPTCPPPPDCGGVSGGFPDGSGNGSPGGVKPGSCATQMQSEQPFDLAVAAALVGLVAVARRRRR